MVSGAPAWAVSGVAAGADTDWIISGSLMYATDTISYLSIGTTSTSTLFSVATSTKIFNVLASGLVGIGTTIPTQLLDVEGATSPQIVVTDLSDMTDPVYIGSISGSGGFLELRDTTNNPKVLLKSYDSSYFTGGSVGIGTTTPAYTLDVEGTLGVNNTTTLKGSLIVADTKISNKHEPTLSVASTTFASYVKILISPGYSEARTITDIRCMVDAAASTTIFISDGTNDTEGIVCDSDGQEDDGSISNGTFTAGEAMYLERTDTTGAWDWLSIRVSMTIDPQL